MCEAMKQYCLQAGCDVKEPFPGILVVFGFAAKVLDGKTDSLIQDLDARLPKVGRDDIIQPGQLQWVLGQNDNLKYRGNALPRRKVWIQDGPVANDILVYSYTGWNNGVALATSDWNEDAQLKAICDEYNVFLVSCGETRVNQGIVTGYDNKEANIGMHYDKKGSLVSNSGIGVIKMGHPRRFCIRERVLPSEEIKLLKAKKRSIPEEATLESMKKELKKRQENMPMIFDEKVPAGTLIYMTMDANCLTQHGVPEEDEEVGLSGSIVFRTVKDKRSVEVVKRKAARLEAGRASKRMRE